MPKTRNVRRTFTPMKNMKKAAKGLDSPKKSLLLSQIDNWSPSSSPLKGPLTDNDTESGSTSFVAKCFYGFKSSSPSLSKENEASPKKNLRHGSIGKQALRDNKLTILQDAHLNEKLLERIAASPIKQAVLQRCSLDEFRKMYRDEIKDIEHKEKLSERRITRKLSKIVWQHHVDSDEDDNASESSDGISFQIPNRGFDVDSISNDNSSVQSEEKITPLKTDVADSKARSLFSREANSDKIQMKTPPSSVSSTQRKFFKSKSAGKPTSSSNVLFGKGFNLRFVRQGNSTGMKNKVKNSTSKSGGRKTSFAEKLRMSCQGSLGSTALTASSNSSNNADSSQEGIMSGNRAPKLSNIKRADDPVENSFGFDDDADLVLMKKENCKTYESATPKRQRMDYSSGNESPYDSMSDNSPVDQSKCQNGSNNDQRPESHDASYASERSNDAITPSKKLFPIFRASHRNAPSNSKQTLKSPTLTNSSRNINKLAKDNSQMIIDAGQKNIGATQCNVCGMIYCRSDPMDQSAHDKFHKRLLEVLKFQGWKKERVVQEIPSDFARIILVLSDDPRSHRKKVEEIYEVMERELGFPGGAAFNNPFQKVFLYVSIEKEIEGCCIAEPITEGNKVIPGDMDACDASGRRPWCCEKIPEKALIGVSRLWVAAQKRRSGVASRLVEAVQQWFDYGSLIPKDKIAFSDPTPDGRKFAQKFTGTSTFLVYKYN